MPAERGPDFFLPLVVVRYREGHQLLQIHPAFPVDREQGGADGGGADGGEIDTLPDDHGADGEPRGDTRRAETLGLGDAACGRHRACPLQRAPRPKAFFGCDQRRTIFRFGAHFGLTSRRIQTGTSIDIEGHISKCGDGEARTVLYEAASAMLVRSKQWCGIKARGVRIAAKRGHERAVVAVARKLAVVMHRMWIDGSVFRFAAEDEGAAEPNSNNPTALAAAM